MQPIENDEAQVLMFNASKLDYSSVIRDPSGLNKSAFFSGHVRSTSSASAVTVEMKNSDASGEKQNILIQAAPQKQLITIEERNDSRVNESSLTPL